jgi:hypothetical protein
MYDTLCMSWSQCKCNPDETHSTQKNEKYFVKTACGASHQFEVLDEQFPMAVFPSHDLQSIQHAMAKDSYMT